MSFVKLDTEILNSSIWRDRVQRAIFITALLMARPVEIDEPLPQYEVRQLVKTGFVVPPGWYGLVGAAGIGIIRRALVEREEGLAALEQLGSEDPESNGSGDYEGRHIVRVDGGYIVLNFMAHQNKDHTGAKRQRRFRERRKMR